MAEFNAGSSRSDFGAVVPIAELRPDSIGTIRGVITIVWPFSAVKSSIAFILAEPEPRLRLRKGQLRVNLSGSSARTLSAWGIGSGDTVQLSLNGAEFVPNDTKAKIQGTELEWQLAFSERLFLQIQFGESGSSKTIDIDHPPQPKQPQEPTTPAPAAEVEPEIDTVVPSLDLPTVPNSTSATPARGPALTKLKDGEFESPAFVKRARISYGALFEDDIFDEDGGAKNGGRKRRKFGLSRGSWRYTSQTPSPEPREKAEETPSEEDERVSPRPSRPHMTDDGCQTIEMDLAEPPIQLALTEQPQHLPQAVSNGDYINQSHQILPLGGWGVTVPGSQAPLGSSDIFTGQDRHNPSGSGIEFGLGEPQPQGWGSLLPVPNPEQLVIYPEIPLEEDRNPMPPTTEQLVIYPEIPLEEDQNPMVPTTEQSLDVPADRRHEDMGSGSQYQSPAPLSVSRAASSSRALTDRLGSADGHTPQSALLIDESESEDDMIDDAIQEPELSADLADAALRSASLPLTRGREDEWEQGREEAQRYPDDTPDRYDDEYDEDEPGGDYDTGKYLAPEDDEDDGNDEDLRQHRLEPEFDDEEAESWDGEDEEEYLEPYDDDEQEDYESDMEVDEDEHPQSQRQQVYMQPPPMRPAAPVVIDLLSDSDDDDEQPPPPAANRQSATPASEASQLIMTSPDYSPGNEVVTVPHENDPNHGSDHEAEQQQLGLTAMTDTKREDSISAANNDDNDEPQHEAFEGPQNKTPFDLKMSSGQIMPIPLDQQRSTSPLKAATEADANVKKDNAKEDDLVQNLPLQQPLPPTPFVVTDMDEEMKTVANEINPTDEALDQQLSPPASMGVFGIDEENKDEGGETIDQTQPRESVHGESGHPTQGPVAVPAADTDLPTQPETKHLESKLDSTFETPSSPPQIQSFQSQVFESQEKDITQVSMAEVSQTIPVGQLPTPLDTQLGESQKTVITSMYSDDEPEVTQDVTESKTIIPTETLAETIVDVDQSADERIANPIDRQISRRDGVPEVDDELKSPSLESWSHVPVETGASQSDKVESPAPAQDAMDYDSPESIDLIHVDAPSVVEEIQDRSSVVSHTDGDDALQAALREEDSQHGDQEMRKSISPRQLASGASNIEARDLKIPPSREPLSRAPSLESSRSPVQQRLEPESSVETAKKPEPGPSPKADDENDEDDEGDEHGLDPSVKLARASIISKSDRRHETPEPTRPQTRQWVHHRSPTPGDGDESVQLAKGSLSTPTKAAKTDSKITASSPASSKVDEEAGSITQFKLKMNRHLRDELPDCTALKVLRQHMSQSVEVMVVALMTPPDPKRARGGPREYMMSFGITDHSVAPTVVAEVQLYRPHKDTLPLVKTGDPILLRNFTVVSLKGKGIGLRTNEGSSWAVFDRIDEPPQIKGAPVEYTERESTFAAYLREWYLLLDDKARQKLEKANQKIIEAGKAK